MNCGPFTKQRLFYIGIAIFILTFYRIPRNTETPCYYIDTGNVLPSVEHKSFSPKERSIFFHETSCRGELTIRQACSVEAAARAHPRRDIYVLFSSPVTEYSLKNSCLAPLLQFHNVKLMRLQIAEHSKGTLVQSILENGMKDSSYPEEHYADILRILTLNKWGGVYLDTDMIVTRSLDALPLNFVAKEQEDFIASGILSFGKDVVGTNVTNEIIKNIHKNFDPWAWSTFGAEVVNAVIGRLCPEVVRSPSYKWKPIQNCKGITIFSYELFYPMYFTDINGTFNPPAKYFDLERPYTYHLWNYLTEDRIIYKDSVYEIIARNFCPTIHDTYSQEFTRQKQLSLP